MSTLFHFIWQTIKGFLEEHTKKKINITKSNTCDELKELFLPEQLQERYGGTGKNQEAPWWPPRLLEGPVGEDPSKIIEESEYEDYIKDRPDLIRNPYLAP